MKRFLYFISVFAIVSMVLAACDGVATSSPEATEVSGSGVEEPQVGEATEAPVTELVTIDLAGPPMEVGSKYAYVDGTVLAAVPGGAFIMGYNAIDNPKKEVSLSDFWIYSTEVTNQQYALCVSTGNCTPPDAGNNPKFTDYLSASLPVTGVNYEQAASYCKFVNGRLPTEAEWEKAARGPEGNIFPWGEAAPDCSLLNFNFCEGKISDIQNYPNGASFYGLFDMAGNVREWVADWYNPNYYTEGASENPVGPDTGERRSVRSSSYQDGADASITAHRYFFKPEESLPDLGFRCVVDDPTYHAPMCSQLPLLGLGADGTLADCSSAVKCNNVNISQGQTCDAADQPITIVNFSVTDAPPTTWQYDAPGCDLLDGDKYLCEPGDGPLSASGACEVDQSGACAAGCPANYKLDGNSCVWDGSASLGTNCLPGFNYDPLTQCCSVTPGSGAQLSCPAGTIQVNGVCTTGNKGIVEYVSEDVSFFSCAPGDKPDEDKPACTPPQKLYCYTGIDGKKVCYCK